MDAKERLLAFLHYKGIGQNAFERHVGIANGYISNIRSAIGSNHIEKILDKYPELDPYWLVTGKGAMLRERDGVPDRASKTIPLYDVSAAAGYASFDEMISKEKIVGRYVVPDFRDIDWMIYVRGGSMSPKYASGDIVACRVLKESQFIQWGKVYVIATREQGMLVKRLEESEDAASIRAVSDNELYKPFDIPKNEIIGVALVVGVIRLE
jgi:phage repressor protein C with HTH and peptisase S24 domain